MTGGIGTGAHRLATLVRQRSAYRVVLCAVLFLLGGGIGQAGAQSIVDVQAEISTALFAAAQTQAAVERRSDEQLLADHRQIVALASAVQAGKAERASLVAAQNGFVAALADKDREYAAAIATFRGALVGISSTPEGAQALARYNSGDRVGALAIIDRLNNAQDAAEQTAANVRKAVRRRQEAALALDARAHGDVQTPAVVTLYEQVTQLDPTNPADWRELTELYVDAGRIVDARAAAERAVSLPQSDKDRTLALTELGDVLRYQGNFPAARQAFETALALERQLLAANPHDVDDQATLGLCLERVGDVLGFQNDSGGALKAYQEELGLERQIVTEQPTSRQRQRNLSIALEKVGDALNQQGKYSDALTDYGEEQSILNTLVASDPGNAIYKRDLEIALVKIGDTLTAEGTFDEARSKYIESVNMRRKLSQSDPTNVSYQRDLSIGLGQLGILDNSTGRFGEAIVEYTEALQISRRLAAAEPTHTGRQFDVSQALVGLGAAYNGQHNYTAAGNAFGESISILRALHKGDPTYLPAAAGLCVGLEDEGSIEAQLGDVPKAIALLRESLDVCRQLAAADPTDAAVEGFIGVALRELAQLAGSGVTWSDVKAQFEAMDRAGLLSASQQPLLTEARNKASSGTVK